MVTANGVTGRWPRVCLKMVLVLAVVAGAQTIFGADLRVDAVAPDFLVLIAVLAGFIAGPNTGAMVGFIAGGVADLFLTSTPFGLSCLAYCLTGFVVGWATSSFIRPHWYLVPVVAAAGTVAGVLLFVVIGYLVGQAQLVAPGQAWLVQVCAVEGLYAAVFGLPAATVVGWALAWPGPGTTSVTTVSSPGAVLVEARSGRWAASGPRHRTGTRAGVR